MTGPLRLNRAPGARPFIAAHRGLSAAAPENTLAAFRLALDAGADLLELDAHLTRDGAVAVIHDRTLQRTTTGNGAVRSYAASELAAFDAGSWFDPRFSSERIPRLDEVLALASGRCWVDVEIKSHRFVREDPARVAQAVLDVVRSCGMLDQVLFSSFDAALLKALRALDARVTTGALYNWHRDLFRRPSSIAERCGASMFICSWTELTRRRLDDAKAAGLAVAVYAVNEPREALRLSERGVDVLISDAPDIILRALSAR